MKFLKRIGLLIYIVIAVEIFFRVFYPRAMLPRYIAATEFGIRGNEKNADYYHKAPEYKVHIKINSKGVRSFEEIPYERTDSTKKRIVLLGDSFGLGYGVNFEESFPEVMKNKLLENNINAEVINLAVSGHSNAEELIMLENEGLKYKPDLVILQFHRSDYIDNVRSNLYVFKNGQLQRKNMSYLPAVKTREKLFSYPLYRWIASNYQTYTWARETASATIQSLMVKRNQEENNIITIEESNDAGPQPDSLTIALLKKINEVCYSNGAEFIVLDTPRQLARDKFEPGYETNFKEDLPGINYVLPLENMIKAYTGEKLYWEKAHGHFTPQGTKIVGETLADFILRNSIL